MKHRIIVIGAGAAGMMAAIAAAELEKLPMDTGRILAAYQPGENQRWLYVLAENNGEVRYQIQIID